MEWAVECFKGEHVGSAEIATPAVVGAVIDLGLCLSLMERSSIELLRETYELGELIGFPGVEGLPKNSGGSDRLRRELDCATVNMLHWVRENYQKGHPRFESVRALFSEGKPIYPESGFMERSHIQICVRNAECIKGYFYPKDLK